MYERRGEAGVQKLPLDKLVPANVLAKRRGGISFASTELAPINGENRRKGPKLEVSVR